jgi:hypothetical protein
VLLHGHFLIPRSCPADLKEAYLCAPENPMRRVCFLFLCFCLMGCSTHPVADVMDFLSPTHKVRGMGRGGVCTPSGVAPIGPAAGPVAAGALPPPPEPPIMPR